MAKSRRREFNAVDQTADPNEFVTYLDTVRGMEFFQEIKRRTLEIMRACTGDVAVDVGCGTGEDVCAIGRMVGPTGCAIGVDISSRMIETARQRARATHSHAIFLQADASKLPFRDRSIDALRAERLLQHTRDADGAVGELARVVRTGGRIVSWEGDLDLLIVDAPDYEASRVIQRLTCDQFLNGAIGHRLHRMFWDAGLIEVGSTPLLYTITDFDLIESALDFNACVTLAVARGLLDQARADRWIESLRLASRAGRFRSVAGGFITFGRKP
jgi:SAM-dependent methyltransferase